FSDVLGGLSDTITFLSQHAPGLTSVALNITGIALALGKVGALGPVLRLTGISNIAAQMTGFAAATRGATLAEQGLLATEAAVHAITAFGWVAIGAAALVALVPLLTRANTAEQQLIGTTLAQARATGFNTAGYKAAAAALAQTADGMTGFQRQL